MKDWMLILDVRREDNWAFRLWIHADADGLFYDFLRPDGSMHTERIRVTAKGVKIYLSRLPEGYYR